MLFFTLSRFQDCSAGQSLLDVVFRNLNLLETAYFGLRYLDQTGQTVSYICFNRSKQQLRFHQTIVFIALVGSCQNTFQTD